MVKKIAALLGVLMVGVILGASGHWYFSDKLPEIQANQAAQKEQERLYSMVRSGKVLSVSQNELTLELTKKGKEDVKGKELTEKVVITENTTVQEGMNILNGNGEQIDITQFVSPGMDVNVLAEDGKALALHFSKSDEKEM